MCPLPALSHTTTKRTQTNANAIKYVRTCPNAIFWLDNLIFGRALTTKTFSWKVTAGYYRVYRTQTPTNTHTYLLTHNIRLRSFVYRLNWSKRPIPFSLLFLFPSQATFGTFTFCVAKTTMTTTKKCFVHMRLQQTIADKTANCIEEMMVTI